MEKKESFSLKKRIKSFQFAISGLKNCVRNEHNAWVHLLATIVVLVLGFVFQISLVEWMAIAIVVGMVWVAELLNTAIERFVDFIEPEWNSKVGLIKDYSAAAVLVVSIIAMVVGALVFIPKIAGWMM